jgi:NADPH:quinone reductase-like Zn-dependent oxidoreductase
MLEDLSILFVNNKLKTVIDREYLLSEIREAHSYVDSGRKKGNIVLRVS